MDKLVQTALLGTARAHPDAVLASPAGALAAQVSEASPEWQLLLRAGAEAVYRQAGRVSDSSPSLPEPAPAESLPACSPGAARLIAGLFGGEHAHVLPEALARLRQVGLRLPSTLLPAALEVRTHAQRNSTVPVIGVRGHWLSRFNPAWQWVWEALPEGDELPLDSERRWNEGIATERIAVLRRMRQHDPEHARTWLETSWRKEKAGFRASAIEALATGLSPDDEPMLEKALDDRSEDVRKHAAFLLARLPGSAFVTRMTSRADEMLAYTHDGSGSGMLVVYPAVAFDPAWQRDHLYEKPPENFFGPRAWWLIQILASVPPSHWEARFGASPDVLLASAMRNDEWGTAITDGWIRATMTHRDMSWSPLLWRWAFDISAPNVKRDRLYYVAMHNLRFVMPPEDAERLLLHHLKSLRIDDYRWVSTMEWYRGPWSAELGRLYLDTLHRQYPETSVQSDGSCMWFSTLSTAALSLPSECFAQALQEWTSRELEDTNLARWHLQQWNRYMPTFLETIRLRQRLHEEIPL